ncbi:MAG: hypothetical protein ABJM50_04050 [Nonlabens ulvanivorans]|uniref:hypothetical protein n=1 Tax=Nonlabens ulvanivorans TaxID=906888 RepID=UPI0032972B5E
MKQTNYRNLQKYVKPIVGDGVLTFTEFPSNQQTTGGGFLESAMAMDGILNRRQYLDPGNNDDSDSDDSEWDDES